VPALIDEDAARAQLLAEDDGPLPRRVRHAINVGERPPFGPQRVEHLVNLTADVDRLIGGRNRLREFRLAKRASSSMLSKK
jgi:hypothetical protein